MHFITKKNYVNSEYKNLSPSLPFTTSDQKYQKILKLKIDKNSDENKFQKKLQVVNFTEMKSSTITREILVKSVQIGNFVLVEYIEKNLLNVLLDVLRV